MNASISRLPRRNGLPRVALTTYSTKPRGGVVHTLELAEALQAQGLDVTVVAMGDPGAKFFREVKVPVAMIEAPDWGDTLEQRVFSWIDAMTAGLTRMRDDFDIVHSQDCISARAAARVRDAGAPFDLVRTVHHVDDFTTQALIDCQRQAILEPDRVLVVSRLWQDQLRKDYGVQADIVTNGVRAERFATSITPERRAELRRRCGVADGQFLYLSVGGIEPRKGSEHLIRALGKLHAGRADAPVLAVIGGHSFQDYKEYREKALACVPDLGMQIGQQLVLLGTVPEAEMADWFAAADGFVFPSVNEGWGLVILEAASAGLPVVASDIPVFHEFLVHDRDAILTRTADVDDLAAGMARLLDEPDTRRRLAAHGPALAARYPWSATAEQHLAVYREMVDGRGVPDLRVG